MFDLAFYNMIIKANKLNGENYKEIYQTYSYNTRENRNAENIFLKENWVYLSRYLQYFSTR